MPAGTRFKLGAPPVDTSASAWESIYLENDAGWDLGETSPPLLTFIEEGILPAKGSRVLVVGCGTGHELPPLVREGYQVIGADFAPSAVKLAKARLRSLKGKHCRVVQSDLLVARELRARSVDWIFDQTFFCALQPHQRFDYAKSMARLLKANGELWALNMRTEHKTRQPYDCTPERYVKLMESVGFSLKLKRKLSSESHPRRRGRETLLVMKKTS